MSIETEKQEPVAIVSGYYGGQCVVLPINPARLFNSGTAFYTHPLKLTEGIHTINGERWMITKMMTDEDFKNDKFA